MRSTVTNRDRIWTTALDWAKRSGYFTAEELHDNMSAEIDDPPSERTVRNTLNAMAELGYLEGFGGGGRAYKEFSLPSPGECEWCGAPFPEAGRVDVTTYDDKERVLEENTICSSCLSDRY